MVIEVPGCRFRIKGGGVDWQVQYPVKERSDGKGDGYAGKYFFPSLEYAIGKAYELMLMESDDAVDMRDVPAECKRAKDALVEAVRKAPKGVES